MNNPIDELYRDQFDRRLLQRAEEVKESPAFAQARRRVERVVQRNQLRVLAAFREAQVSEFHFAPTTGYGYDDAGREKLEEVFARVFSAEAALVRSQIVSGTHALGLCLFGVLRPGEELLSVTGRPYDTLGAIIHGPAGSGSLRDLQVNYREVPWTGGEVDLEGIERAIGPQTSAVLIQRSRGYSLRPALSVRQIGRIIQTVKAVKPDVVTIVDNCYGEFVETEEPPAAGADLTAGSLIKNPGGGIAPSGGYVVGKKKWVERAAGRLTVPGLGGECGPSLGLNRLLFQGFYLAPLMVGEALVGASFAAQLFQRLGFAVQPAPEEERHDLVQAISLERPERLLAFCQAIQEASPVNSFARPEAAPLPGYDTPIIMAAGTFVQGASSELSADAPLRPPYTVFLQGGVSRYQVEFAVLRAAQVLLERGLLIL